MLNSSPAVSTSSVPVGQAAKKAILKGNLCVGSLDLPLPPTNDRILKKYTLSSEVIFIFLFYFFCVCVCVWVGC